MSAPAHPFTLRHVQLLRALFAAAAGLMITFSSDHSAAVGLAVFSGFALTTALLLGLAAWLVALPGARWPFVLLAAIDLAAGLVTGVPGWRTTTLFFVVVITWALLSGAVEILIGLRSRRAVGSESPLPRLVPPRDAMTIGAVTLLLGVLTLIVPSDYVWEYMTREGERTLTGIIIAVGLFGGYAAIVAVYLGIAGFSPERAKGARAHSAPALRQEPTGDGAAS